MPKQPPPSRPALAKRQFGHPVEDLGQEPAEQAAEEQQRPSQPSPVPLAAEEPTVMLAFRAPKSLRRRLRQLAAALDRPLQELSVEAFEEYLERHKQESVKSHDVV